MDRKMKAISYVIAAIGLNFALLGNSYADKQWNKTHPRRTEVNRRLKNQNRRIDQGVKNGKLTQQQAQELHAEDKNIRNQERGMAKMNGGHITKEEQKTLNQEENRASRQIYQEKHNK